jgi:DNA-binding response OmpR family regulator
LLARIKAVLRRTSTPARGGRLGANGVEIDPAGHRAYRDGAPLELTAKEFALLECFLRHPGVALTRQTILDQVWGFDYYGDLRTVDVHVQRLRKKIEPDPPRPRIVTTVPGLGYRLEAGSDAAEDS